MPNSTITSPVTEITATRSNLFFTPWRLTCLGLLLLSALVYLPSLQGEYLIDDTELTSGRGIGNGTLLGCFTVPFLSRYFRPLVALSFFLENRYAPHATTGLPNPFFYHQTNLLIHVATTGLLLGLLGAAFPGRRAIAFWGGLLFAVQPMQAYPVAWIGGRTDALCTLFATGFAWSLVAAARETQGRRAGLVALSAFLYGCALFSKEQAMALLPLVPLAFACFRPPRNLTPQPPSLPARSSLGKGDSKTEVSPFPVPVPIISGSAANEVGKGVGGLGATLPFIAVSLAFVVGWKTLQGFHIHETAPMPFHIVAVTTLYYLLLLFVPLPRWIFSLSLTRFVNGEWGWAILGFALLGLAVALFVRWFRREPAAAWLLALALLPIVPISNVFPIPSLVIVSYRVGLCGPGAAALLGWFLGNQQAESGKRKAKIGLGVAIAVWYLGLTVWSERHLASYPMLMQTIQSCDPDSITAHEALYHYYMSLPTSQVVADDADVLFCDYYLTGRPQNPSKAVAELESLMDRLFASSAWRTPDGAQRAFESDPRIALRANEHRSDARGSRSELAMLLTKLGLARLMNADISGADTAFQTALRLQPGRLTPTVGRGECAFLRGDNGQAKSWAIAALVINPNTASAYRILGDVAARLGHWRAASVAYAHCLRLRPDLRLVALRLAEAQSKAGDAAGR